MDRGYDPFETDEEENDQDCPEGTALISVDDFYDLLMEQQEQM